jgi:activator of HSP90 ATPase
VREREDGQNCNNWHWSEKDLTPWSKEQLTERLVGLLAFDEGSSKGWCKITALDKMKGEVTVQSRKQKKFPLYELEILLKWAGELWDENGKVVAEAKGKIKIPDLSEETWDDLEMTVTCDDETAKMKPLKEAMRTTGCKRVREACMAFRNTLQESVSSGADKGLATKKPPVEARVNNTYVVAGDAKSKVGTIKLKYSFHPPPHVMYETLLDTNRIRGATASDASMSTEVGGKFMMLGGSVEGENVALTPFSDGAGKATIVWKWRFSTWQPGLMSKVTIDLVEKDGGTHLEMTQTGVPEEEVERTEKGWRGIIFDRLNSMLGGNVIR